MRRAVVFRLSFALLLAAMTLPLAAQKLSVVEAFFEDPDRRVVRNLTLNAGETCYLSFRVSGFRVDTKQKVELEYHVQFLDPNGVPVVEDFGDKIEATLSVQDKDWMPKIDWQRVVPSFAPAGEYKIKIRVEDKIAKADTSWETTFKVRGETIDASDKVKVTQFIFSDTENGRQKMDDVYHQGSTLWARFKLTGFKIVDKSYWVEQDLLILDAGGKELFRNPTVVEKNRAFYPPKFLSTSFNLDVSKGVRPGEYTLRLEIRDKTGEQSTVFDQKFSVQP